MILNHVADRARFVVELPSSGNAEVFRHGNLHALNMVSIPDRLNNRIVEPEVHKALHCTLTQVVVDPENGGFRKDLVDRAVQLSRRGSVATKRFLDNDPRPVSAAALSQG